MPGLVQSPRWRQLAQDRAAEHVLVRELGVPAIVARVLAARGVTDPDEARLFLNPSLKRDWADPLLIPGMSDAADRVMRALADHEVIAVFGDFDVDGMSSTCLLTLALRRLGAEVHPFIPNRFGEGYGLSREALARVRQTCEPDLVITVDNGIAAREEVAWLASEGVDVVVTDHHEPADLVPEGVPVTDPKLSADCPSRELAGAGVALKLVCELGRRLGQPDLWLDYIDVATLGTLSDMMLLQGENRALVAEGLARMRRVTRPGLVALAATASQDISQVTADGLPFSIIPRLNAAGRMGSTDVAFDLLLTDDPAEAAVLAGKLEEINTERRNIESALTEAAMAKVKRTYQGGRCVVVGGEGWHEGVKGIVASRIVNRYHVPAILFTIQDGIARGSGRSIGEVNLFHAVEQCSDVLVRFGGHAGAVGVTCEASRLDEFRGRLEAALADLPAEQFQDTGEVTATVGLSELTAESIGALEMLQPFGQGNKKPLLASVGVTMRNRSRVGADGAHLRFLATDGMTCVPAIMFRAPDVERAAACDGAVDLVFEAVNETWQGRTKPKLMVRDICYRDQGIPGSPELLAELGRCEDGCLAQGALGAGPADAGEHGPYAAESRAALSALAPEELTFELVRRLIGERSLLPAQARALELLGRGRSCMAVMATGRGKSLVFHVHAAREAILHGRASVFVYPLRALVADQAHHLATQLADLGVSAAVLTGETDQAARERTYAGLAAGGVDVLLTTPEYLSLHVGELAACGRVGFLAIDEAHHAGMSKSGHREAYADLPAVRAALGGPTCLAVTATARSDVAREACRLLGIDEADVVVDATRRPNLSVCDGRDLRDREGALVSVVAPGQKTIVYVSSRDQSVQLVRTLRHRLPELADRIAFYNAGLPREVRARVERAFRDGGLSCIVSTSAFGEGVNLPDVRDVVLYGLPYGAVELNQMSGRAGRDGLPARVHMLFSARDMRVNERVISQAAPARDDLVALYRAIRTLADASGRLTSSDEELLAMTARVAPALHVSEQEVQSGLSVFAELGFLTVCGWGEKRCIVVETSPARMELARSARYLEGENLREEFREFADWVFSCPCEELLAHIDRPITPGFGSTVTE